LKFIFCFVDSRNVFESNPRFQIIHKFGSTFSKGHGFAGGIKRHSFNRQPTTHGASDRTRAPGSSGATTTAGRVFKGTRRPGRMGNDRVTTQNLEVIVVDAERHLLAVKGSVPGAKGGLVIIKAAVKTAGAKSSSTFKT